MAFATHVAGWEAAEQSSPMCLGCLPACHHWNAKDKLITRALFLEKDMGDWGAKSSRELVHKAVVVLVLLLWFCCQSSGAQRTGESKGRPHCWSPEVLRKNAKTLPVQGENSGFFILIGNRSQEQVRDKVLQLDNIWKLNRALFKGQVGSCIRCLWRHFRDGKAQSKGRMFNPLL